MFVSSGGSNKCERNWLYIWGLYMMTHKEAAAVEGSCSKSGWMLLAVRVAVQLLLWGIVLQKKLE